jgi:hypothetical protein
LTLVDGALTFAIDRPHSGDWTIHAGPYTVRVVGTAFRLAWSSIGEQIDLEVRRGRVEVVDTRVTHKKTEVSGGNALHLRQHQGWPVIAATRLDGAGAFSPANTGIASVQATPRVLRSGRSRAGASGGGPAPVPKIAKIQRRRADAPPPGQSDTPARVPDRAPTPPRAETESASQTTPTSPPETEVDPTPSSATVAEKDPPEKTPPEPVKVARLDPTPPTTLRATPSTAPAPPAADSAFFQLAVGLTDGAAEGDTPLEVRVGGLGQLSPQWAVGATGHLWTRASDPASKCNLIGDCGPEELAKESTADLHQRYAMALVATARFTAWETEWVDLALEADAGLAVERWTSKGSTFEEVDGKKVAQPYEYETWLTGTQLALRPVLVVPLGTPRLSLTLSGEVGARLGMAVRAPTSSGPATAISPPLDALQFGGHLGLSAAF